jgi:hypothetical protein
MLLVPGDVHALGDVQEHILFAWDFVGRALSPHPGSELLEHIVDVDVEVQVPARQHVRLEELGQHRVND